MLLSGHLLYECEVLFGSAQVLEGHTTQDLQGLTQLAVVTLLESFTIHARNLHTFLFRSRGDRGVQKDDALAEDYFSNDEWSHLRPRKEDTLAPLSKRVAKEIAHISYSRGSISDEAKNWNFAQIAGALGRPLRFFSESVAPEKVAEDFKERLWEMFPLYLRQPAALSFPADNWPPPVATGSLRRQ